MRYEAYRMRRDRRPIAAQTGRRHSFGGSAEGAAPSASTGSDGSGGAGMPRGVTSHTGRWLIMISGEMKVLPRPRVRALGIRNTRPVRRQAVSSRRNAPRP